MGASGPDRVATVNPQRFSDTGRLLIAGLAERYYGEDVAIGDQWRRFATYLGRIAGQVGRTAYGISYNAEETGQIDYLCGVEVTDFSSLPRNFNFLRISAQRCAVFTHRGPLASIRHTWTDIWSHWLPHSGYQVEGTPFERYGESFDPKTGTGGAEIWIPITASVSSARLVTFEPATRAMRL